MARNNNPQDPFFEPQEPFLKPGEEGPFFLNDGPPTKTVAALQRDLPEIIRKAKDEAVEKAVHGVVGPGGHARGEQKSDAADKWRIPAVALAEEIWQESPDLPVAIVGQRIRKLLEDKQPPSDRALKDHIRPLKPQK
jgi:hypothetical protein